MRTRRTISMLCLATAGILGMIPTAAFADDLRGADRILCSATQTTICDVAGECETGPPWLWNIPQFVEIDLEAKSLRTTKASGEDRATPFKNLEREDGIIFLQGVEAGRAFSFVIHEETGDLSAAVARNEITVSVFGACTPLHGERTR